ncbi:MAG: hypothetical protein LBH61_03910, partial [Dysgonamonadaceae bacterium]|nr:hypothetical protein [Dysgonamonadaceae bacterium]
EFKVYERRRGVFSTLAKAEQAMKECMETFHYEENETFGFHIEELYVDSMFAIKTTRNYLPDGSLWDECLTSSLEDEEGRSEEFFGRPAEKVRFQNGDLAEELIYQHGYGYIARLVIVGNPPISPERISKKRQRWKETKFPGYPFDYFDDLYYVLLFCEEDHHPYGYAHNHPFPINLFPVRFPVSDEIKNNLENHYRNYRSWCEQNKGNTV